MTMTQQEACREVHDLIEQSSTDSVALAVAHLVGQMQDLTRQRDLARSCAAQLLSENGELEERIKEVQTAIASGAASLEDIARMLAGGEES